MLDGGTHRGVIGHVALHTEVRAGFRGEVQDRHLRTAGGEAVGDGCPDAGGTAGHECCRGLRNSLPTAGAMAGSGVGAGEGNGLRSTGA